MKCTYYSYYPYNRPDLKYKCNPEHPKCSYPDYSLRFIKSAVCETDANLTPDQFVSILFEGLDVPYHKGMEKYTEPFCFIHFENNIDDVGYHDYYYHENEADKWKNEPGIRIKVSDNRNLYGATNHDDGIWEIDGRYYIKSYLKGFRGFSTPKEAIEFLSMHAPNHGYFMYKEIDYELRGDECLKWGNEQSK